MAAPVKQRPGRYLAAVALFVVALYLGVFLGPSSTPALGLDLRGGTEVVLSGQPLNGGKVTKSELDQAVTIIRNRVNGLGVGGAVVNAQGSTDIVVSVPGKGRKQVVDLVGETALLRFRQVMTAGAYIPTPTPSASPSATATVKPTGKVGRHGTKGGSPTPTTSSSATKSKKKSASQGDALSPALLAHAKHSPKPTASPTGSVNPAPTATPATGATPAPTASSSQSAGTEAPLPNSESPSLTTAFAQAFSSWDCSKNPNPTNGRDLATDYIIACDPQQRLKYILAPAALEGSDVKSASAALDQTGVNWDVNLNFTGHGSSLWYNLTRKTYEVANSAQSGIPGCAPPKGCNAIGITLDGIVQSAPATQVDGIPGGNTQISGSFTHQTATDLANVLKYGSLPLKFSVPTSESVSATLGTQQLRGGLIAGAIGLALVVLFSLLYYRALGLVTVGSLLVSGLILYAVTTLLGHSSVGYTLSLPGIAGFIVAIGITADSFVVFFERLRDEIREGRRLRSAVDRGWPRARRTILSADTVSLLAAVILYVVSIGDVRGFAFTLGLSTLSDLFIVFFFTKPLLMVLAKWKAFDSGKSWTGIGKARAGVVREVAPDHVTRASRSTRTKEA